MSVEGLSCTEEVKKVLRRIITSDRSCDVVRSDGRRERWIMFGIDLEEGRIGVTGIEADKKQSITKWPRVETFMSWQETN